MTDQLDLIDTIARAERFSTFSKLLRAAEAKRWIIGSNQFTIFAPTNDAFAKLPAGELNELLKPEMLDELKALLSYHILPGKRMAANLASVGFVRSITGQEVSFAESNGLRVNGAAVGARNIEASNGVVHAIAEVLKPPTVRQPDVLTAVRQQRF